MSFPRYPKYKDSGVEWLGMVPGHWIKDLQNVKIAVAPIDEQTAIAAFLDTETAKLDTLTAAAQRAIDLLQERRTALISAAVTGQIDVRGLVASSAVSAAASCV
jgi:type I restriction enzyme S subunit